MAWYNTVWLYRKKITIDATKISGTQTNFPYLFSSTDNDLRYTGSGGHVGKSDGTDIVFTDSDGITKLSHEIENYTSSTGALVAWVKIPSITSASNKILYIYYGNAAASDQQNVTGTWDSNYFSVWHLNINLNDSTTQANNGTAQGGGPTTTTGKISGGRSFDGITNYMSTANSYANSTYLNNSTVEVWVNTTGTNGASILAAESNQTGTGSTGYDYRLYVDNGGAVRFGTWNGVSTDMVVSPASTYNNGAWYYIVAVSDSSAGLNRIYINGTQVNTVSRSTINTLTEYLRLGSYKGAGWANSGDGYYSGLLDEVRVSNTARSAGWILTSYNSQNSPSTFYSLGSEEILATTSSFCYRKSITVDHTKVTPCSSTPVYGGAVTTSYAAPGSSASFASPIVGSNSNRIAIVTVAIENTATSTVTWDGTAMTLAVTGSNLSTHARIYYLLNPPTGSTTVGVSFSTSAYFVISAFWYYNVAQQAPTYTNSSTASSTDTITTSVTVDTIGDLIISNLSLGDPNSVTPNSSQIEITDLGVGGNMEGVTGYKVSTATGSNSIQWTASASTNRLVQVLATFAKASSITQDGFPVYIEKTDNDLRSVANGGHVTYSDGSDICFFNSTGGILPFQLVSYDDTTGSIRIWVKLTISSAIDTVFYIYYGDAYGTVTSQADAVSVWTGYNAVWHLEESGNGTAGEFIDSSGNGRSGQGGAGTAVNVPTRTTGKLGYGQSFDGNDFIQITGLLGTPSNIVLSTWANLSALGPSGSDIISLGDTVIIRFLGGDTGLQGNYQYTLFTWHNINNGVSYIGTGWHYLVYNIDIANSRQEIYVDGVSVASGTDSDAILYTGLGPNTQIGRHGNGNANFYFTGLMDEIRVSSIPKCAGWVATEYTNQNDPSTFVTFGSESIERLIVNTIVFCLISFINSVSKSQITSVNTKTP
jgi:hypothetical protein